MTLEQIGILVAILTSIAALAISWNGNFIARDALHSSNQQFLLTNRPLVQVTPKRFKDGKFWQISQNGNALKIAFEFEIKNIGNLATRLIGFSPSSIAVQPMNGSKSKPMLTPISFGTSGFALAPGTSYTFRLDNEFTWATESETRQNLEGLMSNPNSAFTQEVIVHYANPADTSKKYMTIGRYRMGLNETAVLKVDYQEVSEPTK